MEIDRNKNFDSVAEEYCFYLEHSTEEDVDSFSIIDQITQKIDLDTSLTLLDYGSGNGKFLVKILEGLKVSSDDLYIELIEIGDKIRHEAVSTLSHHTNNPIKHGKWLAPRKSKYDLIISNHVLYYVNDLDKEILKLWQSLKAEGLMLINIAGKNNVLVQLWNYGFNLIQEESPYHHSEDIEYSKKLQNIPYLKQPILFEIAFQDTEENRLKIIQFLFSEYMTRLPLKEILAFFDAHKQGEKINIQTVHDFYILSRNSLHQTFQGKLT